jgi:hypothetical protein
MFYIYIYFLTKTQSLSFGNKTDFSLGVSHRDTKFDLLL